MKQLLTIVFVLTFVSPSWAGNGDFDKVCDYFAELELKVSEKPFSKTQKKDYIDALVKKNLQPDSPARLAWEVVLYGTPEVRFELFKTSAEETTKEKWRCESMEKLLPTTGE